MGSGVGATSSVAYGTSGTQTVTGTWTPSAVSGLVGGSVLKIWSHLWDTTLNSSCARPTAWYSGPLVATGISTTEWTFSGRIANPTGSSSCKYYGEHTSAYIDNLTLTGNPTSVRMYPQNVTQNAINVTVKTGWNVTGSAQNVLGPKVGSNSTPEMPDTSTTNPNRVLVYFATSLPFVRDCTVTHVATMNRCTESDAAANMYIVSSVWVTQEFTNTNRSTLLSLVEGENEFSVSPSFSGRGVAATAVGGNGSIVAGDGLAWEIGFAARNSVITSYTGYISRGDTSADLTEGAFTGVGWIETTLSWMQTLEVSMSIDALAIQKRTFSKGYITALPATPDTLTELNSTEYASLTTNDNDYLTQQYVTDHLALELSFVREQEEQINLHWRGKFSSEDTLYIYVFNHTDSAWELVTTESVTSTEEEVFAQVDTNFLSQQASQISDYYDVDTKITFLVTTLGGS